MATSQTTWAFAGLGLILLGVLRTTSQLFVAPAHVRAWAIGAGGEERLGSLLESLEVDGFVVLHDLRVPRSRENIDHLLIGPSGVFVVETKTYNGSVRVRGGELFVNGRRKTGFLDQVERQVAAVEAALGVGPGRGFICVLDGDFPWFGRPSARGIEVTPPKRLLNTIRSMPIVIDSAEVERRAELAIQRLRR